MQSNITSEGVAKFYEYIRAERYDYAITILDRMSPPQASGPVHIIITLAVNILAVGFYVFVLNSIKKGKGEYINLLDGCSVLLKVVGISVLNAILVIIPGLFLIIPGIIAYFMYSMSFFILADSPEKGVIQCLKESRMLMKGNKQHYFMLVLSFFGWFLLECIPGVGYLLQVFIVPYFTVSKALFYLELRKNESITYV